MWRRQLGSSDAVTYPPSSDRMITIITERPNGRATNPLKRSAKVAFDMGAFAAGLFRANGHALLMQCRPVAVGRQRRHRDQAMAMMSRTSYTVRQNVDHGNTGEDLANILLRIQEAGSSISFGFKMETQETGFSFLQLEVACAAINTLERQLLVAVKIPQTDISSLHIRQQRIMWSDLAITQDPVGNSRSATFQTYATKKRSSENELAGWSAPKMRQIGIYDGRYEPAELERYLMYSRDQVGDLDKIADLITTEVQNASLLQIPVYADAFKHVKHRLRLITTEMGFRESAIDQPQTSQVKKTQATKSKGGKIAKKTKATTTNPKDSKQGGAKDEVDGHWNGARCDEKLSVNAGYSNGNNKRNASMLLDNSEPTDVITRDSEVDHGGASIDPKSELLELDSIFDDSDNETVTQKRMNEHRDKRVDGRNERNI